MTCCGICISLRGAAYFVTSVQTFCGFHLFLKWVLIAVIKGQHIDHFEDSRQRFLYPLLLIYIALFCLLGIVNFLAVQKESGKILKWATRLLLILQIVESSFHLLVGFGFPDEENEDIAVARIWHLQRFGIGVAGSVIYFGVLFLYSRALLNGSYISSKKKDCEIEDRYYDPPTVEEKPKKRKQKGGGTKEEQATLKLPVRPTAPPPTPSPNKAQGGEGEEALKYIDAEEFLENEYVAGPDKKALGKD